MNLDEVKELIAVMRKNRIRELDLEQEGTKIHLVAAEPPAPAAPIHIPVYLPGPAPAGAPAAGPAFAPAPPAALPVELKGVEIVSPMVGTFYRAPAPDAPPYVETGATVGNDTVLCIVEAMKLMNEIKAEMHGRVLRVLVENGQPVEFGQPLFLVEPL